MGRVANRMTAKQAAALREPGRHADGGGLYLHVKPTGWRGWCYITRVNGKRREIGLGAFPAVSLADARAAAARIRLAVADGADPMAAKPAKVEAPKLPTFGEAADEFVASMESGWRNDKNRAQWRSTIATYCTTIRDKPVAHVGTDDVLAVLTPIWHTKAETASRLRGRIERILNYAAMKGWRERGVNPAAWKGNLALTLPPATEPRPQLCRSRAALARIRRRAASLSHFSAASKAGVLAH